MIETPGDPAHPHDPYSPALYPYGPHPYASDTDWASARHRRPLNREPAAIPSPPTRPQWQPLIGRYGGVEPLDPVGHSEALFYAANAEGGRDRIWAYTLAGPFASTAEMRPWLDGLAQGDDPMMFTVVEAEGRRPVGMAALMNIRPGRAVIELGHIWLATTHQRGRVATEALLLMRHALDSCVNRRLEWKCNALNQASRRAALRLGFRFEGVFLNDLVSKGRNRDTAWYSLLDSEWPAVRANADLWLDPGNFDQKGRQRLSLGTLNRALW